MRKMILFLIRKRFGLKEYELCRFTNQKTSDHYYFTDKALMKVRPSYHNVRSLSQVSLNWILDDECKVRKLGKYEQTNLPR